MSAATMPLTQLLGTQLPLIQAPMAGVQGSALALAVCSAGALGSLPCAMLSHEQLRSELAAITQHTSRPYNVNFFCHTTPAPDARLASWAALLAPFYAELGLEPLSTPAGASRTPFDAATANVLAPFKPPVVSFHFGLPAAQLLAQVKSWGAKVLGSATTLAEGQWLQAHGADAVIAQGLEAGGHRGHFLHDPHSTDPSQALTGQMRTFALVPQLVRALRIPVIAAGGIADAQGVATAMALGAAGVQIGTAYLLCPEATTSAVHRAALGRTGAAQTLITNLFTGRPARGITNRVMRELGALHPQAPAFPLAAAAMAPLRARAEALGLGDFSPLWAGENTSGCRAVPAAQLTRELMLGFGAT